MAKNKHKQKDVAAVEQVSKCPHCGAFHRGSCPKVYSIEYNPDGSIKQVNYRRPYKGTKITREA